MSIERPSKATRCQGCGKTGAEKLGSNNWRMCNTCFVAYCSDCYRKIKQSSNACTDHNPWGKWLIGGGTYTTMKFK